MRQNLSVIIQTYFIFIKVLNSLSSIDAENRVEQSTAEIIPFKQKYPGLEKRRKYFWAAAKALQYAIRLRDKVEKKKQINKEILDAGEIFRIRLLEILTATHRVYLEPDGPIYGSIITYLKNPNDMSVLFKPDHELYNPCVDIMCNSVVDIIQKVTEFMPKEGIIGTNSSSALIPLISNGNRFPEAEFMEIEKDRLEFDEYSRIKNINQDKSMFLIMHSFITKGLVKTLLLKPVKSKLLLETSDIVSENCKLIATILLYVVRTVNDNSEVMMDFPWELRPFLYTDEEMKDIYKNENIDMMLNRSKMLFKVWTDEYVTRLAEASKSASYTSENI